MKTYNILGRMTEVSATFKDLNCWDEVLIISLFHAPVWAQAKYYHSLVDDSRLLQTQSDSDISAAAMSDTISLLERNDKVLGT